MFTILDGRKHFYQWDIDRKLIVADKSIEEVHFSNRADGEALICATYLQGDVLLVDVPNILLQDNWRISAYAYDENHTRFEETYDVKRRSKPADYVYTETEVKNYDDLAQRIEQIEENGISDAAVENAVEKYLEENDIKVDLTGYATEQYVQEQIGNIDIPEVDLSEYAKKSEIPSIEGLASEDYVQEQIENIPEPVDEVHVGANAPTDANVKIWVDTDAESPVATKEYVQQKIAEAQMSGADVDLSAYYTKTETDNAIEQAVGAIEIPEVDLSEYAKKSEIPSTTGLATEQYVQDEIGKIEHPTTDLSGYYTKSETDAAIKSAVDAIEIPEGGSDADLSNYYTKAEVDAKIPSLDGYAKTSDIPDVSGYQTAEEVQSAINEALSAIGIAEEGSF